MVGVVLTLPVTPLVWQLLARCQQRLTTAAQLRNYLVPFCFRRNPYCRAYPPCNLAEVVVRRESKMRLAQELLDISNRGGVLEWPGRYTREGRGWSTNREGEGRIAHEWLSEDSLPVEL